MTIIKGRQKLNIGPVIFSSTAAFFNIVKMNVGIGVLSMPNAVANAGWGLGAGSMALLNIMTIHCMLLLVRFFIRNVPRLCFQNSVNQVRSAQTICRRSEVQFLDYAGSVESLFKSVAPVSRFSKCGRYYHNYILSMPKRYD